MGTLEIEKNNQFANHNSVEKQKLHNENPLRFIIRLSLEGIITYITKNSNVVLGYEPEELIGVHIRKILHQEDYHKMEQNCPLKKEEVSTEIYRMTKKDGTLILVEATMTVISYSYGHLPPGIIILVKELKEKSKDVLLEEEENHILESEKLKVAGQLAAGIAHEIKNPLTSIKGFIQLMKSDKSPNQKYLEIIEDEIQRLEIISGELLVLAKPHTHEVKITNLTRIVKEVVFLLEAEALKKSIQVKSIMETENVMILCESPKIKQVLINLVKNAIEAMNEPGIITVHVSESLNEALVSISDQGCGIPDEYLKQLGKPFFSTKETGNGLGLMICQKIISDHGGKIAVSTSLENGTTFTVKIPLMKGQN